MKGPPVHLTDIVHVLQFCQIPLQFHQLVVLSSGERSNGNSVVDVEPVGVERVIDDDDLAEVSVEYSKIFDIGTIFGIKIAVVAI